MRNHVLPDEVAKSLLDIAGQLEKLSACIKSMCDGEAENTPDDSVQLMPPFAEEEKPAVSLEDVRAVLADKSRDGYTKEVRSLITSFGASRLSEIDPKDYGMLLEKAEGIGHA